MHRRTALALCGSVFGAGCLGFVGDRTPTDSTDAETSLPATDDSTPPPADEWPTFGADAGNRSTNPATTGRPTTPTSSGRRPPTSGPCSRPRSSRTDS
jgi:hypothetical protein